MNRIANATVALANHIDSSLTAALGEPVQISTFSTTDAVTSAIRPLVNVDMVRAAPSMPNPGASSVALEIDYLITFLGDESSFVPHRLLEGAMTTVLQRPLVQVDGGAAQLTIVPLSLEEQVRILWRLNVPGLTVLMVRLTGLVL